MNVPFWQTTPLARMSDAQWEQLCDGCGRCCLLKLEDIDTGEIAFTDVGCRLLDGQSCRCSDYENRAARVPDCLRLTPDAAGTLSWLPGTCAYRMLAEGRPLAWWHPLVSGDPDTVHHAGISVRGRTVPETEVGPDDLEDHVVDWPDGEGAGEMSPPGR